MQEQVPLLLLPGLMNDARVWDSVRQSVGGDRQVVVAPTDNADSISALAEAAVSLMPPGPFAVAGFSLGGYVAQEVCRIAHDRIMGLALLDTGAQADSEEAKQARQRMVAALGSGAVSFDQVASGFASRILHPSHLQDAVLLALLIDMARSVGTEGFARQQTAAMNRQDSRDVLATLTCPALVLCGLEDQVTPSSWSEEMADLLAGDVELVLVPECGHMSTLEQTSSVNEAVGRWLRRVDDR